MTSLAEYWRQNKLGQSIKLSRLCEITADPYTRLIIRPDQEINNNRNKELAAMVADMWQPFAKRWTITDRHFCYNNLPRCVYEVHMDRGKITFSLSVPEVYGQQLLRRAMSLWNRATITTETVKLREIRDITVLSMSYKRSQIYSINTHKDIDVLRSWLEASNCLIADDWARIVVHTTPICRENWQKAFRNSWDSLKKGIAPPEGNGLMTAIVGGLREVLHSALFGAGEMLGKKPEENTNYFHPDTASGSMAIARLSPATKKKGDSPALQTRIWIASHSQDETRARSTAQLIAAGFGDLAGDNELRPGETGKKAALCWLNHTKHPLYPPGMIMSHEEIGQLWRLPGKELQEQYRTIDAKRQREVTLPEELFSSAGVPIGYVTERGRTQLARIPWKDADILCRGHTVLGPKGCGKTAGVAGNYALAYLKQGYSVYHIEMADDDGPNRIRDSLPIGFPEDRIIELDCGNLHNPPPLDMADVAYHLTGNTGDKLLRRRAGNKLTSHLLYFISQISSSEQITDRMEYYANAVGRAVLGSPGRGLFDYMMCLTSPAFRQEIMAEVRETQPDVWDTLNDLQNMARKSEGDKVALKPIIERLGKIASDEEMAFMFLQPPLLEDGRPLIDFRKWMDEGGYYVIMRVPKGKLGSSGVERVAGFLAAKLWLATLTRIDTPMDQRRPYLFIADEPHNFLNGIGNMIADMAVEARKYRASLLWLAHGIDQFKPAHWSALSAGGSHLTIYRTDHIGDMRKLQHRLYPYSPDEIYKQLPKRWEAVSKIELPIADDVPAFIAKMLTPPKRVQDRSKCRNAKYSRHWSEVAQLIDRRKEYLARDEQWRAESKKKR